MYNSIIIVYLFLKLVVEAVVLHAHRLMMKIMYVCIMIINIRTADITFIIIIIRNRLIIKLTKKGQNVHVLKYNMINLK